MLLPPLELRYLLQEHTDLVNIQLAVNLREGSQHAILDGAGAGSYSLNKVL